MMSVKQNAKALLQDLRESSSIIFCILLFVVCYSRLCYQMLQGTNDYVYFDSDSNAFYNMFILLTTANFPDIMLPSYANSWIYCFLFIDFLIVVLYLMLNLLLANFYSKFQ